MENAGFRIVRQRGGRVRRGHALRRSFSILAENGIRSCASLRLEHGRREQSNAAGFHQSHLGGRHASLGRGDRVLDRDRESSTQPHAAASPDDCRHCACRVVSRVSVASDSADFRYGLRSLFDSRGFRSLVIGLAYFRDVFTARRAADVRNSRGSTAMRNVEAVPRVRRYSFFEGLDRQGCDTSRLARGGYRWNRFTLLI